MRRSIFFASLWCVSCASDGGSLMQVGVGLTSRETMQAGLQVIKDALAEVPHPGTMRQMAIDALMRSVSEAPEMDEESNDTLWEILELLRSINTELRNETKIDQKALNDTHDQIGKCNTWGVEQDEERFDTFNESIHDHNEYMEIEENKWEHVESNCTEILEAVVEFNDKKVQFCVRWGRPYGGDISDFAKPAEFNESQTEPYDVRDMNLWLAFLDEAIKWAQDALDAYDSEKEDDPTTNCFTTYDAWDEARKETRSELKNSQLMYCIWKNGREAMCEARTQCYDNKTSEYEEMYDEKFQYGHTRIREAMMIDYIICLIQKLRFDKLTDVVTESEDCKKRVRDLCDEDQIGTGVGGKWEWCKFYMKRYNVFNETIPNITECDVDIVSGHPSDGTSWMEDWNLDNLTKAPIGPLNTTCP